MDEHVFPGLLDALRSHQFDVHLWGRGICAPLSGHYTTRDGQNFCLLESHPLHHNELSGELSLVAKKSFVKKFSGSRKNSLNFLLLQFRTAFLKNVLKRESAELKRSERMTDIHHFARNENFAMTGTGSDGSGGDPKPTISVQATSVDSRSVIKRSHTCTFDINSTWQKEPVKRTLSSKSVMKEDEAKFLYPLGNTIFFDKLGIKLNFLRPCMTRD